MRKPKREKVPTDSEPRKDCQVSLSKAILLMSTFSIDCKALKEPKWEQGGYQMHYKGMLRDVLCVEEKRQ